MTERQLLSELRGVTRRLGIGIQEQAGCFSGGICRLKGQRVLLLNPALSVTKTIEILCRALSSQDLSHIFILPVVRALIEQGGRTHSLRR